VPKVNEFGNFCFIYFKVIIVAVKSVNKLCVQNLILIKVFLSLRNVQRLCRQSNYYFSQNFSFQAKVKEWLKKSWKFSNRYCLVLKILIALIPRCRTCLGPEYLFFHFTVTIRKPDSPAFEWSIKWSGYQMVGTRQIVW
jgi:hypothetical protein